MYATRHGHQVGRVEVVARIGGKLRRLELADEAAWTKVAAADTPNALEQQYPAD
jgi:hypothetical protein